MGVIDTDRRWLVVVAHPDDETLGCGALLSRLRDVDVVHVTDGAPRNGDDARRHGFDTPAAYAAARWREARAALDLAGVPEARHHGFGIPDQGAAFAIAAVVRRLLPLVERADAVLTHVYEGGHPDHDAVACAVHAAAERVRRPVVEMPFYHAAGRDRWVRQRFLPVRDRSLIYVGERRAPRARPNGTSVSGEQNAGPQEQETPHRPLFGRPGHRFASRRWSTAHFGPIALSLTPAELDLKRRMAACYATQGDTLASFRLHREAFRAAPSHRFARPPHGGDMLYERHGWGIDRAGWTAAVRAAWDEILDVRWP